MKGAGRTVTGGPAGKELCLKLRREPSVRHGEIGPPDHAVKPEQRQRVIAEFPLRRRRVSLEAIHPSPQEPEPVPQSSGNVPGYTRPAAQSQTAGRTTQQGTLFTLERFSVLAGKV